MWLLVIAFCLIGLVAGAQQGGKALTNQDVISMVKNLLPEGVILSAIKTNDTDFDVSANGLIALKKAGVTAKVMEAMLAAANNKKNSASAPAPDATGQPPNAAAFANGGTPATAPAGAPAAAAPGWQPKVSFLQGNTVLNLIAEATEIVQTKSKATSLASLAADQAMNEALNLGTQAVQQAVLKSGSAMGNSAVSSGTNILGGILGRRAKQAKITYVWALTGGSSTASAGGNPPTFEVNYAGIPGVNADQFEPVIVKLTATPQSTFRLVGATEAATTAEQSTQQDWPIYSSFVEDRVAAKVQKLGSGHAQVAAAAPLAPGQYAIALRPTDKSHKFSGEDVAKNQGEGLLFNYTWSFLVK
ncbi:MAG TPA: hypothetical protein VEU31_04640 [Candidatus Acidoferrales bacterium]|nr:hypothetical protein [Candidatus Acidoferrales bacterium]